MKTDSTETQTEHTIWNRLLILIISLALLTIGYLSVVQNSLATPEKLMVFLKESKVFNYTADIVKSEISDKLPQKIKDNIIESALITRFMDFVITADNIEKLAEPGLKIVYRSADTPTSIVDNRVVIDTTTYKSQASSYIAGLKLSEAINQPAQDVINSVPTQLTLLDTTKHPNSPLATLIKIRDSLHMVNTILVVAWWSIIITLLLTILINLRSLKRLCKTLAWGFGTAGIIIFVGSWLFPALISVFGPKSSDPVIGESTNGLINSIINTLFVSTRTFGILCLIVAVVSGLIYYFVPMQKVQDQLDTLLHKNPKMPARKNTATKSHH